MNDVKQIDEIAKLICTYPQCIHHNSIGECASTECQTVDIAEALYKQGYRKQKEGEWISIDESYTGTDVWDNDRHCGSAKYIGITHWMPLPTPPKEDKND